MPIANNNQTEAAILKRIAAYTPDMFYRMSLPEGKYEYVSAGSFAIFGVTPEDWLSTPKNISKLIHPNWLNYFNQKWSSLLDGDALSLYEYQIITKNGETKWLNQRNTLISDEQGNPVAVEGIITDITQSKQTELKLHNTINLSPSLIAIANIETGYFIECNPAITTILGYTEDEFTAKPIQDFIHPDDRQRTADEIAHQLQGGLTSNFQNRYQCKDGSYRWLSWQVSTADNEGKVYAVASDIHTLKQTESLVENTSQILAQIASGAPASIVYDAIALMYEARHPGMRCSMLELKEHTLIHSGAPSLPKAYCDAINGLEYGPNVGSCGTATFTGKTVLVEDIATDPRWENYKQFALPHGLRSCWSQPIKCSTGQILGAFGMYYNHTAMPNEDELADLKSAAQLAGLVIERERREAKLRNLSQAIEQAGESVIITDSTGLIEYVNPAFTTMTGYSSEEVLGKTPRILKSGMQTDAYYEELWATISSGKVFNNTIIDRRKDGSQYPAIMSVAPIFDDNQRITNYVALQQDMTEYKLLEAQFRQSQKMEALGTLVGGIAHDFNNMLAGITGNLYLAKQYSVDNPYVLQKLGNVESLSYRAAEMIKQLLTFARKDVVNMKQLPITSFIKETLKLLQSSVPENIDLNHNICTDALIVNADATQIHQMLLNLINNACDALEDAVKPRITISLEAVHVDDEFIKKHMGFITGEYAHLSVQDNGCGISESMINLIFEPFSTTKEVGKGTGLGLAMVFGAVKNHQGFIEVESTQNEGSTFHIYFPLALVKSNDVLSQNQGLEVTKQAQGETILFVDDQEDIVETTSEVLESMGYQVITAANGEQAVEVYKSQAADIDLIIMDVVMPIMSGDKAAQMIRQLNPNVKIIFSTGYDKFAQLEMNHEVVISKPFSIEKMSNLIRQTIDN